MRCHDGHLLRTVSIAASGAPSRLNFCAGGERARLRGDRQSRRSQTAFGRSSWATSFRLADRAALLFETLPKAFGGLLVSSRLGVVRPSQVSQNPRCNRPAIGKRFGVGEVFRDEGLLLQSTVFEPTTRNSTVVVHLSLEATLELLRLRRLEDVANCLRRPASVGSRGADASTCPICDIPTSYRSAARSSGCTSSSHDLSAAGSICVPSNPGGHFQVTRSR